MNVLTVAYPFAAVGADAVGGAEQVVTWLDGALVEAGHTSLVMAREDSVTAGRLVAIERAAGVITDTVRRRVWGACRDALRSVLAARPVDLVHMHGIDFHHYLPEAEVPVLVTLHLPLSWYPVEALAVRRPHTWLHCVSATQRRSCPAGVRLLGDVPNGVPVKALEARHARRDFALMLGRICPEKGFHLGVAAAQAAGVPLLIGGEVHPYAEHRQYFAAELRPRLDERRRYLGAVGFRRKRRLLTAARCLLVPSLAAETSSLVAMEALACGTPVIAFRTGALPELIDHGRTGFLVEDAREMAAAISAVDGLDREHCRQVARERFALVRMTGGYMALYAAVLALSCDRSVHAGAA